MIRLKKTGVVAALVFCTVFSARAWIFGDNMDQHKKGAKNMGQATANVMKIGDTAPDFKNLLGVDGKKHSLSDYAASNVLVVMFTCNHCPYVQAYEGRMIALQAEFQDKGVQFVAINANDDQGYPDDDYAHMVTRAKEKNFNFPYLRDESQAVAKAYHASHTPHIYVFNNKHTLAYTGKIDDNWQNPDQVKQRFLRDALTALVQGKAPSPAETYAIGCTIKWKN
jgi:peroxiredoxin